MSTIAYYLYPTIRLRHAFALLAPVLVAASGLVASTGRAADPEIEIRFGKSLFHDERLSSPQGEQRFSCSTCHVAEIGRYGTISFTDGQKRSPLPLRAEDEIAHTARNTPTLLGLAAAPSLHWDGEFDSLEQLAGSTLLTRNMGWLKDDRGRARLHLKQTLSSAPSLAAEFSLAFGANPGSMTPESVTDRIARAIAAYVGTLDFRFDSPYDEFIRLNGIDPAPALGEEVRTFARRQLKKIERLRAAEQLQLTEDFDARAVDGFVFFFRTDGETETGNCVSCHVPPLFTDFSFHNTGISQFEFDAVHGTGRFADLAIPPASEMGRPSPGFASPPDKDHPGRADLGHWNFVDPDRSALRQEGETAEELLTRMIGTFKTPTLRNLHSTAPFQHDGSAAATSVAISTYLRSSNAARSDRLRSADPELKAVRFSIREISEMTLFLKALNDKP